MRGSNPSKSLSLSVPGTLDVLGYRLSHGVTENARHSQTAVFVLLRQFLLSVTDCARHARVTLVSVWCVHPL